MTDYADAPCGFVTHPKDAWYLCCPALTCVEASKYARMNRNLMVIDRLSTLPQKQESGNASFDSGDGLQDSKARRGPFGARRCDLASLLQCYISKDF